MKHLQLKIATLLFAAVIPLSAKANMIWPSLYITAQYYSWYIIPLGLLIEFFAIMLFLKQNWWKSATISLTINFISAILGLILIPASGIFVELLTFPFGGGTFDISHWILDYLAAILCNVAIEGLALKWIFKYPFKKNFWWLFVANAITIIICLFVPTPY